jgi:hypothetical protein
MATTCGIRSPQSINLVFGWRPIPHDHFEANLSIAIQLYDAAGHLIGSVARSRLGIWWTRQVAGGRLAAEDSSAFRMRGLVLQSEFFVDRFNARLDIGRLLPDVCSVSFVAYCWARHDRPHTFKRPFVRFIEPILKTEIGLFSYRLEDSEVKDAIFIGGLYFANDSWTFAPVVRTFNCPAGFGTASELAGPIWVRELSERGVLPERMVMDQPVRR